MCVVAYVYVRRCTYECVRVCVLAVLVSLAGIKFAG